MEAIRNFRNMGYCTIKILDDDFGTINIVESPDTYMANGQNKLTLETGNSLRTAVDEQHSQ